MPGLAPAFFNELREPEVLEHYPVFVETGTYLGHTIFAMESLFKELHTIEIQPDLHARAQNRYSGDKIHFHLGDSAYRLPRIVKRLHDPTIFFLDGHWSSGVTGRGDKDCPLYEELDHIVGYFRHRCIVIIDDARLFGQGPSTGTCAEDWEDIDEARLLGRVNSRLTQHYRLPSDLDPEDRLVLHLEPNPLG